MKRKMAFSLFVVAGGLLTIMVTQRGLAAPPAKVLICHVDPDCDGIGPEIIEVSERSLDAHLAHGDCLAPEGALPGDACPGLEDCTYPDCENDILLGEDGEDEEEEEEEETDCNDEEEEEDCPKTTICHFPPGGGEPRTITICNDCLGDHLGDDDSAGHGDFEGTCEDGILLGEDGEDEEEEEEEETDCNDEEEEEDCPKTTICHFPPGGGEPRTITICNDCLGDHLGDDDSAGHGDFEGTCEDGILLGEDGEDEEEEEDEEACDEENEPDCEQEDRVTICHIPPGNPGEARTLDVCPECVVDHIEGHGDLMEPCETAANAKVINGLAGGDAGFDAPGSACGALGMLSLSLGLVGIGGLRLRRKRFCK